MEFKKSLLQRVFRGNLQTNYPLGILSVTSRSKGSSQTSARPAREWLKYAAAFLLIFTLGIGNVWGAVTYQSYEDNVLDTSTEIGSSNVSSGTAGKLSWTGNNCTWASTRLNIAANGYITFTASSGNNITKIVIYSASTGYYGTWTSNPSGTVTTSSGTTTITGLNANSVRITTSTAFRATPGADTYIKIYYTEAFDGCDIFYETFNSCNKNGGNDDTWSDISTTGTIAVDNAGWTFVQGNAASKCARFGTGSNKGSAETPAIAYTGSKNLILTFKAGAWNGSSEQTTLNLSATNATLDKSSVTMTKGEWDEFTVTLSSVSNNFKIKWEGKQASNSRFFLDEICIEEETGSTKTCDLYDCAGLMTDDHTGNLPSSVTHTNSGWTFAGIWSKRQFHWQNYSYAYASGYYYSQNTNTYTNGENLYAVYQITSGGSTYYSTYGDGNALNVDPASGSFYITSSTAPNYLKVLDGTTVTLTATGFTPHTWTITEHESGDAVSYTTPTSTTALFTMPDVEVDVVACADLSGETPEFETDNLSQTSTDMIWACDYATYYLLQVEDPSSTVIYNQTNTSTWARDHYSLTGLTPKTTYTVRVYGVNACGETSTYISQALNTSFTTKGWTVTYNYNGATGTPPVDDTEYANSGSVTLENKGEGVSKTGYYFAGWALNSSGTGTIYQPGATYTITSDVTFHAKWVECTSSNTPQNVAVTNDNTTAVTISWDAVASATRYHVYTLGTTLGDSHEEYVTSTSITITKSNTLRADDYWVEILPYNGDLRIGCAGDADITLAAGCPDYSFYYGTTKGSEDHTECFSFVTGSTDTWLTDLWTIPSANQWTYVGEPEWDASPGKSANLQLSNMPYALNHANNLGSISSGVMEGAQGYVKICSNSSGANRYVGFIPAGYVFRWGSGESWSSINFTGKTNAIEEEDWYTPLQTWTSSNADDFTYVGLKTSSGYVWANRSETRRPVFFKPNSNWLQKDGASKDPKFAMYYYTSDEAHNGWSAFMEDPDGDGIYEAWIPNNYNYAKVIFVRFPNSKASTGDWTNEMNQTGNLTLQNDKNVFTLAAGKWGTEADEGSWSLYDKKGTFHISANSNTNNWYCHFLPHHVLTYDANGGSGAPDAQSIAVNASPCRLTIAAGSGMTAPTGHHFIGWNPNKTQADAGTVDGNYDPSDTPTMSADVPLYAVWAPNTHALTWVLNGGEITAAGAAAGTVAYGTSLTAPTVEKEGNTFTGWSPNVPATMPDDDATYSAQWSVNSYRLTWDLQGGTTTSAGTGVASGATGTPYSDVAYGTTLEAPSVSKTGYNWGSWSPSVAATMPAAATTYTAQWNAKTITVTWDENYGTTPAQTTDTYTYDGAALVLPTPVREHYTFIGWYKNKTTTTNPVDNVGGSNKPTEDVTYYAHWTKNKHILTIAQVDNVTISSTTPALDEGDHDDNVEYQAQVTLSYTGVTSGLSFFWDVYKTGEISTKVTVDANNQFRMPDYNVTVSAKLYQDPIAWCAPSITVEGDVWLTSYAGVPVYTTINPNNMLTITGSDLGNTSYIKVKYRNKSTGDEYTKSDAGTLFKLYTSAYAQAENPSNNITPASISSATTFAIQYTPGASEYNQIDNWELVLEAYNSGDRRLNRVTHDINGRALPQKFVIAAQYAGKWYALPADLNTASGGTTKAPYLIDVELDGSSKPINAIAPSNVAYKGGERYNANSNRGGISLYGYSNNKHVIASKSNSYLYMPDNGSSSYQDWYLTSSDFDKYNVHNALSNWSDDESKIRYMRMSSGTIGQYQPTNTAADNVLYLLPITEINRAELQVVEWKTTGIVFMYTGNPSYTAEVTINGESKASATTLSTIAVDHGVYEMDVADLTNSASKFGTMNIIIKNADGDEMERKTLNVPILVTANNAKVASVASGLTKGAQCPQTDVVILNGGVLSPEETTENTGYTFNSITVYGGGKLEVPNGTYLTTKTMYLRAGSVTASSKGNNPTTTYNYVYPQVDLGASSNFTISNTKIYYDYVTNKDQYFALALPTATTISNTNITYPEDIYGSTYKKNGSFLMKAFDSKVRSTSGAVDAVWVDVETGNTDEGSSIYNPNGSIDAQGSTTRGWGYYFLGMPRKVHVDNVDEENATTRQKYGIQRIQINVSSASAMRTAENGTASVSVINYDTDNTPVYNKGWWYLGNPYMYNMAGSAVTDDGEKKEITMGYIGSDGNGGYEMKETTVRYVTIPNDDASATYNQKPVADCTFPAFKTFYVQVKASGSVNFTASRAEKRARLMTNGMPKEIELAIALNPEAVSGDTTNLLIGDEFTTDYDLGDDLMKMAHAGTSLFTIMGGTDLFANALSAVSAMQGIPVGYTATEAGSYTFSNVEKYDKTWIKHLWLTDFNQNVKTDLLISPYTFSTDAVTNRERFALNVELKSPGEVDQTTDFGTIVDEEPEAPQKFIYHDKMYILYHGVIYDAVGKKVKTINK